MSGPRLYVASQTPAVVQFGLEGIKILDAIPAIEMTPEGFTWAYCPLATSLFKDPNIGKVKIEKGGEENKQFISIHAVRGSQIPLEPKSLGDEVVRHIKARNIFNESGLIKGCKADQPDESLGKFGGLVSKFMAEALLPTIRKNTGHIDADIRLVRLYPRKGEPVTDLGVTLHNGCATCSISVLATLKFAHESIQQHVFEPFSEKTGGQKMGGFIVLPTYSGSPSFTFRPSQP